MPTLPDQTAETRSEMVCPECWEEGLEKHDAFASRYDDPRRTLTHATKCPHDDCEADRIAPEALDEQVAPNAGGSGGGLGATISSVTPDIGDMSRKSAAAVIVVGVTLVLYGILPVLIGPVFSSGSAAPAEDTSPSTTEPSADSNTTSGIKSPGDYYVSLQPDGAVITNGDRYIRSDGSPSGDPVHYDSMDSARSTYSEFLSTNGVSTDAVESTTGSSDSGDDSDDSSTSTDDSDTTEESPNSNDETATAAETTGILRGTVFDQDTSPIPQATVRIEGEGISDETDSDGQYFLTEIPAGEHTVVAETAESTTTVPFEITEAGDAVVDGDPDNTLYTTETGSNVLTNSQLNIIESSTATVVASGSGSTLTAPLSLSNSANADDVTVRLEPERTNGTATRTISTADSGAIDRASTSVELPSDISTTQSLALASVVASERVNVTGTARGSETLSLPGNRQPTNLTLTINGTTGTETENVSASIGPNMTNTTLPVGIDGDLPANVTVTIEPITNTTSRSTTGTLATGVDKRVVRFAGNDNPDQLTATVRGVENLTPHTQSVMGNSNISVVYQGNQPAVGKNGTGQPSLTISGAGTAEKTTVQNGTANRRVTVPISAQGVLTATPEITVEGANTTGEKTTVPFQNSTVTVNYSGNKPAVGPEGSGQPTVTVTGAGKKSTPVEKYGSTASDPTVELNLSSESRITEKPEILVEGTNTTGRKITTRLSNGTITVNGNGNLRPVGPNGTGKPLLTLNGSSTEAEQKTINAKLDDSSAGLGIDDASSITGVGENTTPHVTISAVEQIADSNTTKTLDGTGQLQITSSGNYDPVGPNATTNNLSDPVLKLSGTQSGHNGSVAINEGSTDLNVTLPEAPSYTGQGNSDAPELTITGVEEVGNTTTVTVNGAGEVNISDAGNADPVGAETDNSDPKLIINGSTTTNEDEIDIGEVRQENIEDLASQTIDAVNYTGLSGESDPVLNITGKETIGNKTTTSSDSLITDGDTTSLHIGGNQETTAELTFIGNSSAGDEKREDLSSQTIFEPVGDTDPKGPSQSGQPEIVYEGTDVRFTENTSQTGLTTADDFTFTTGNSSDRAEFETAGQQEVANLSVNLTGKQTTNNETLTQSISDGESISQTVDGNAEADTTVEIQGDPYLEDKSISQTSFGSDTFSLDGNAPPVDSSGGSPSITVDPGDTGPHSAPRWESGDPQEAASEFLLSDGTEITFTFEDAPQYITELRIDSMQFEDDFNDDMIEDAEFILEHDNEEVARYDDYYFHGNSISFRLDDPYYIGGGDASFTVNYLHDDPDHGDYDGGIRFDTTNTSEDNINNYNLDYGTDGDYKKQIDVTLSNDTEDVKVSVDGEEKVDMHTLYGPETHTLDIGTGDSEINVSGNGTIDSWSLDMNDRQVPEDPSVTIDGETVDHSGRFFENETESISLTQAPGDYSATVDHSAGGNVSTDISWMERTDTQDVTIEFSSNAGTETVVYNNRIEDGETIDLANELNLSRLQDLRRVINTDGDTTITVTEVSEDANEGGEVDVSLEWDEVWGDHKPTLELASDSNTISVDSDDYSNETFTRSNNVSLDVADLTTGNISNVPYSISQGNSAGPQGTWYIDYQPVNYTISPSVENPAGTGSLSPETDKLADGETASVNITDIPPGNHTLEWSSESGRFDYNITHTPTSTTEGVTVDVGTNGSTISRPDMQVAPGSSEPIALSDLSSDTDMLGISIDNSTADVTLEYAGKTYPTNINVTKSGNNSDITPGISQIEDNGTQTTRVDVNSGDTLQVDANHSANLNATLEYRPRTVTEGVDVAVDGTPIANQPLNDSEQLTPSDGNVTVPIPEIDGEVETLNISVEESTTAGKIEYRSETHPVGVDVEAGGSPIVEDVDLSSGNTTRTETIDIAPDTTLNVSGSYTDSLQAEVTYRNHTVTEGVTVAVDGTPIANQPLNDSEQLTPSDGNVTVPVPEIDAAAQNISATTEHGVVNATVEYVPIQSAMNITVTNSSNATILSNNSYLSDREQIERRVDLNGNETLHLAGTHVDNVTATLEYRARNVTEDVTVERNGSTTTVAAGTLRATETATATLPGIDSDTENVTIHTAHAPAEYNLTFSSGSALTNLSLQSDGVEVASHSGSLPAGQQWTPNVAVSDDPLLNVTAVGEGYDAELVYRSRNVTENVTVSTDGNTTIVAPDTLGANETDITTLPGIDSETENITVRAAHAPVDYNLSLTSGTATHNITVTDENGSAVVHRDQPLPSGENMTVDVPITSNRTFTVTADGNSNYTTGLVYQTRNETEGVQIETTGDNSPEVDTGPISPGSSTTYTVPVDGNNVTVDAAGPVAYELNYSATTAPEDVVLAAGNTTRQLNGTLVTDRTVTLPSVTPGTDELRINSARGGIDLSAAWTDRNGTVDPMITHSATGNVLCSVEGSLTDEQSCYIPDGTFTTMTPTLNVSTAAGPVAYELSMNGRAVATDVTVSVNERTVNYPEMYSENGGLPTTFDSAPTHSIGVLSDGSNTVGVSTQPVDGIDTAATTRLIYEGPTQWTKAPVVNVTNAVGETRSRSLPYSALEDGRLKSPQSIDLPQDWFTDGTNTVTVSARDGTEVSVTMEATGIQDQDTNFD